MVQDELQKAFFTGIGMLVMSREKARQILDRMVEEARISAEDAERLLSELSSSGQDGWSSLKTALKENVRGILDGFDVASGKEQAELLRRVENLEKRFSIVESMQQQRGESRREP